MIVEIDGISHDFKGERDKIRQAYLERQGYCVVRFSDDDVNHHLLDVFDGILKILNELRTCE